jgi:predicted AAA+ superfamily ATPase
MTEKLNRLVESFPAVVLTGARQAGKTTLLREIFPNYRYVSLDLPSNAEMAETAPEDLLKRYPAPVIIDEVQYAPGFFRFLKTRIDANRHTHGQYLLTGSQKFTLMRSVSDSLAGRCGLCELETLSLAEAVPAGDIPLESFIVRGGYPELYRNPRLQMTDFYEAYIASYLERDVRALLKVRELRDFERFLRALALRSGQTLNKADLARDVGISSPTANEWVSVLQASNQILLLEPWFSNKTKSLVKSPKVYLADSGLLCHLIGIRTVEELLGSSLRGAVWETFVFSELRKQHPDGVDFWHWREQRGTEVDFLVHSGGRFDLLECKWSTHPDKSDTRQLAKVSGFIGHEAIRAREIICRTQAPYKIDLKDGSPAVNVRGVTL